MRTTKEAKLDDDEVNAIAKLQRGDISALEVLVLRYQLQALRTAYLICRNHALAEDVVQSTFLRVYERISQFDISRPFAPWLLQSVVNNTLQVMRQQGRTTSIDDASLDQGNGTADSILTSNFSSLEHKLDQLDTNEALTAALSQLPPEQRAAVVMHYYLGLSTEEISERLDCTAGTARWRLYRGRARLRSILEPFWRATRRLGSAGSEVPSTTSKRTHADT